jgi:dynein intermediate chain
MAIPRESEWTDMQKTIAGLPGGAGGYPPGHVNGTGESELMRSR